MLLHCGIYSCFVLRKKQVVSFHAWSFSGTVFSGFILFSNCLVRMDPFQELSFQTGSFSGTVFSEWILFRNCLFRLDPFQELFWANQLYHMPRCVHIKTQSARSLARTVFRDISFSGSIFAEHILCRNCPQKPYPLQKLSLQTLSFTGTVFADRILYRNYLYRSNSSHTRTFFSHFSRLKNLFLGTITFPGKHLCNYLFPENIPQGI